MIFRFDTTTDHDHELAKGSYFAYDDLLFLKMMPSYFLFDEDGKFSLAWV